MGKECACSDFICETCKTHFKHIIEGVNAIKGEDGFYHSCCTQTILSEGRTVCSGGKLRARILLKGNE